MTTSLPTTIPEYLEHLRKSLAGADPALVQDALYDAEEYLRSELAENPDQSEAEVIAAVASSYGAPEEVADIYRDTEVTVNKALRAPPPPPRKSMLGRFFGVLADPYTYGSMFYMVLAMATGIFYFVWVATGLGLSLGLIITIIGIPLAVLLVGSVRVLALVEGRIVEALLGERMPRRPLYADRDRPWLERIAAMFKDPRTWSTLLYMMLLMPLGICYFTLLTTLIVMCWFFALIPLLQLYWSSGIFLFSGMEYYVPLWLLPLTLFVGFVLTVILLHMARGIGRLHGRMAKHMLVRSAG